MRKITSNRKRRQPPCRCGVCQQCVAAEELAEARFARLLDPYYYCRAGLNSRSPLRSLGTAAPGN